jgi:hypothetical protein
LKIFKFHIILGVLSILFCESKAQGNIRDSSINIVTISPSYSYQFSYGDLSKRFGNHSSLGIKTNYQHYSGWVIGLNTNFIFGLNVKEDGVLDNISTSEGQIINQNGQFEDYTLLERGFDITLSGGRLFKIFGPNQNSGILLTAGAGLLQHKILIQNFDNKAPQITTPYKKGYDRLSNGLSTTQFIGYQYLDNKRLVNFFIGIEFTQGFTANRRSFNFDSGIKNSDKRLDLFHGLRIGWTLPLYNRAPEDYYYF